MSIKILAYCDSLCEPKGKRGPGPMDVGYWAVVKDTGGHTKLQPDQVLFAQHEVIRDDRGFTLTGTCNQAEYYGLIRMHAAIMTWLAARNIAPTEVDLHIYSDSQLMVRQMNGEWKIRNGDIKLLHTRAEALKKTMAFTVHKIAREENGLADSLAQSRVLKHSSVMGTYEEGTTIVKQHTPSGDFLRGKNPYALLQSRMPDIKKQLLRSITAQASWVEIEAHLAEMKIEMQALQSRIQPINARVDEWLKATFLRLDADLAEFHRLLVTKDRPALSDAVSGYFSHMAQVPTSHQVLEADGLSQVSTDFLCDYKRNKGPRQANQTINEIDQLEAKRGEVYHEADTVEATPVDSWAENCGVDPADRDFVMDGRFEE